MMLPNYSLPLCTQRTKIPLQTIFPRKFQPRKILPPLQSKSLASIVSRHTTHAPSAAAAASPILASGRVPVSARPHNLFLTALGKCSSLRILYLCTAGIPFSTIR